MLPSFAYAQGLCCRPVLAMVIGWLKMGRRVECGLARLILVASLKISIHQFD